MSIEQHEEGYRTRGSKGPKKHIHLDPECPKLKTAKDIRPVDIDKYPHSPICRVCSGEAESGQKTGGRLECPYCGSFEQLAHHLSDCPDAP